MGHGQNQGVQIAQFVQGHQLLPVFVQGFRRIGLGVADQHVHAVIPELAHHIHHAGIAQVRHVFLKGKAQNAHPRAADDPSAFDHPLDRAFGHVFAHIVVDPAPCQDHFRMKAQFLGLEGQVIGIHADAVAAHQAGPEGQEVPFAARRFQHLQGIDAQALENDGQFVHQGDVQVALGVLDDLGRLGHLDAGGAVDARPDHRAVDLRQQVRRGLIRAGNDFGDGFQGVNLVAGIDALRRIAHREVAAEAQARFLLQDGHADFFRQAGIDRGFIDHHATLGHMAAHGGGGPHHGREVRGAVVVDGRWHGHDDHRGLRQVSRVAGVAHRSGPEPLVADFTGAVVALGQFRNASGIDVETQHVHMLRQGHGQGQAHIPQAHHGQRLTAFLQRFKCDHGSFLYKSLIFRHQKICNLILPYFCAPWAWPLCWKACAGRCFPAACAGPWPACCPARRASCA